MDGSVVGEGDIWKVAGPIQLLGGWQSLQQAMQGPIESLAQSISLGVVRGGASLLDAIETAELLDQQALEVAALI